MRSPSSQSHSFGVRKTSNSRPSSVPSAPMSVQYSHRAVVGRLMRILERNKQRARRARLKSALRTRQAGDPPPPPGGGGTGMGKEAHDSIRAPGTLKPN